MVKPKNTAQLAKALALYKQLAKTIRHDFKANAVSGALRGIAEASLDFLTTAARKPLISQIAGKSYFAFEIGDRFTRPINESLFSGKETLIHSFFDAVQNNTLGNLPAEEITKACYSVAMSFCALSDLLSKGDQKTPGTFFEYLIGHLFAKQIGLNPREEVEVLSLDRPQTLPTDFIFDLGIDKPKIHLPTKLSTRERVIQVWAHQRVLDGVYGTGRFLGILVCLTETKMDRNTLQVIEICLPGQWRVYQMFIAQMTRIYYLDVPKIYADLNSVFPKIHVAPFGDFFTECETLLG